MTHSRSRRRRLVAEPGGSGPCPGVWGCSSPQMPTMGCREQAAVCPTAGVDVKEAGRTMLGARGAAEPGPAPRGISLLSLEPSLGADWPCWGVLTSPCAGAWKGPSGWRWWGRASIAVELLEGVGCPQCWGVSVVGWRRSQGGRAVGEPWVRAQPPAPAAKVEFTPSRAGPAPLFSVSIAAL